MGIGGFVISVVLACGCADPGSDALEAVIVEAEALVAQIESGVITPADLARLADELGPELVDRAREEARKLGPARRAELAARWQAVSRRLRARLEGGAAPEEKILAPER